MRNLISPDSSDEDDILVLAITFDEGKLIPGILVCINIASPLFPDSADVKNPATPGSSLFVFTLKNIETPGIYFDKLSNCSIATATPNITLSPL